TDVAVISLAQIITSSSARVGGDKLDEAIINYVKRKHNLLIGERTAEIVKITIATVMSNSANKTMEIKGRDLVAGVPKMIVMSSDEVREALTEPIHQIVETVLQTLERTPPELAADIVDRGIVLVGGGALLRDFDQLLRAETKLPIVRAEDPFTAVALGAGKALDSLDLLREVAMPN
ncbi:MAG: rod shape-determining protein, partial [Deltaproteobacteria bacterium]|nr:rod shape-determining protein [Deltaproteobacteria bacterium]